MGRSAYHTGEIEMQTRAGTRGEAARMSDGILPALPGRMPGYLARQTMAAFGTVDPAGRVWASLLAGPPGFLEADGDSALLIRDPRRDTGEKNIAWTNLTAGGPLGVLAINLAERRRLRINGPAMVEPKGAIRLTVEEFFGNCPKYIQARTAEEHSYGAFEEAAGSFSSGDAFTEAQGETIRSVDTFFLASRNPGGGADVSHRGGRPGFVNVEGAQRLSWGDFSGNGMFQTLGNILLDTHVGLVFPDFQRGSVLQLTGRAKVLDDPQSCAAFAGAERVVEFELDEVGESPGRIPVGWNFLSYSPFLP
jgi:predicted pyridoxine 5'-phosphate oxidase superfamily flavin-nucleotide-binding protein